MRQENALKVCHYHHLTSWYANVRKRILPTSEPKINNIYIKHLACAVLIGPVFRFRRSGTGLPNCAGQTWLASACFAISDQSIVISYTNSVTRAVGT